MRARRSPTQLHLWTNGLAVLELAPCGLDADQRNSTCCLPFKRIYRLPASARLLFHRRASPLSGRTEEADRTKAIGSRHMTSVNDMLDEVCVTVGVAIPVELHIVHSTSIICGISGLPLSVLPLLPVPP